MEPLPAIIVGIYGLVFLVFVVLLVYYIALRVKKRKLENFEKRDN